jgi:hypothetical protein
MAIGQGAGEVAALSVRFGTSPKDISAERLQTELKKKLVIAKLADVV